MEKGVVKRQERNGYFMTDTPSKWTVRSIRMLKGKRKIAALTAYDVLTARLLDKVGVPLILVGDSLGMTVLGYDSTLPVTMEDMLHHTSAVTRGVEHALVVGDMPFLSYQGPEPEAVINAGRFLKEAGADAVKIEGGAIRAPLIRTLLANGIPVMGHLGLTPQSVKALGGYRVQGRDDGAAEMLRREARILEDSGVFSIVLECVPADLAAEISADLSVPTIGIGAGPGCDGQILVLQDMLGLFGEHVPKFVKRYAELGSVMTEAFTRYRHDVEEGAFPTEEHSY